MSKKGKNTEGGKIDLIKLFSTSLNLNIDAQSVADFDNTIPLPLRQLYAIKKAYDSVKPNNYLFRHQDRLTLEDKLDLSKDTLTFLTENQGNWYCFIKKNVKKPIIYRNNWENTEGVSDSLSDFLTSYALQELAFEMEDRAAN